MLGELHQVLRRDFPPDRVPIVLKPLIYQNTTEQHPPPLALDLQAVPVMANIMVRIISVYDEEEENEMDILSSSFHE